MNKMIPCMPVLLRALLVEYEANQYDPVYRMPTSSYSPMSFALNLNNQNKIYPVPSKDELFVNWEKGNNEILILRDIMGREILREKLNSRITKINIRSLQAGIYLAQIINGHTSVYQQKIIKK